MPNTKLKGICNRCGEHILQVNYGFNSRFKNTTAVFNTDGTHHICSGDSLKIYTKEEIKQFEEERRNAKIQSNSTF